MAFSILFAGFSAASVALIGPFLKTLFLEETSLEMDAGQLLRLKYDEKR